MLSHGEATGGISGRPVQAPAIPLPLSLARARHERIPNDSMAMVGVAGRAGSRRMDWITPLEIAEIKKAEKEPSRYHSLGGRKKPVRWKGKRYKSLAECSRQTGISYWALGRKLGRKKP